MLCHTASKPPEHGRKPGGSAVPHPQEYHQQQAGVRHVAASQDQAGDRDCRVQETAGWGG